MIDRVKYKNVDISRLGLGTMRLPCKTPLKREANPLIDYNRAGELVDLAYQNGVNYFDTAYMYHAGKSEKFIGTALKKYPRNSYYLADKLPIWMCHKPSDMEKVFQNQLERTGMEYFDFYLLHSLDKGNWEKCLKYGAVEFVEKKMLEGKVKNFGFSFHGSIDDLKEIVRYRKWDFAQIQMNYLDWKNQRADEQYDILTKAGIPVIVMEPVRGGKLANPSKNVKEMFLSAKPDASIASWAIRFVASHENVLTILSGMNSTEQMMDNIGTLTNFQPMDEVEYNICNNAAMMLNKNDVIPCTGCDYCADCPKGVKISSIFSIYNQYKNGEATGDECAKEYQKVSVKASECINCGNCKTHCPQSIDIPHHMQKTMRDYFE